MTKQEAIEYFGGTKALAEALGVWPQAIYYWREHPPPLRQYQIEELTQGALRADKTTKGSA